MIELFQNHPVKSLAWIAVVIAIIITHIQDKMLGAKVIGNSGLTLVLQTEQGNIIDTRPLKEFRTGHIKGSHHFLPTDISKGNLGKLHNKKDQAVILVNKDGLNLLDSAKDLKKQGFTKIYILKDGIFGWTEDNLILVKD